MLLGNNILKPLGAEIKLFSAGNGILMLKETEIKLKETPGGHYTLKVADIGQLCGKSNEYLNFCVKKYLTCDVCRKTFESSETLEVILRAHISMRCDAQPAKRVTECFMTTICMRIT